MMPRRHPTKVPPGGGWVQDPEAHIRTITLLAMAATGFVALILAIAVIVFSKASQVVKGWLD